MEPKNPCEPNPCGLGAICDSNRNPVCFCPESLVGNPFRQCVQRDMTPDLCKPGPCGRNADCYVSNNRETCFCKPGFIGDPYASCREPPRTVCEPNPCSAGAQCIVSNNGQSMCTCPDGLGGDPTSDTGCHGFECRLDEDCSDNQACIGFRCKDPCPGSCGIGAHCKVERHHPVCFCDSGLIGNPVTRCYQLDGPEPPKTPCYPNPCGDNAQCTVSRNKAVCTCLSNYLGNGKTGCHPECTIHSDCPINEACINKKCENPCASSLCGINAECHVYDHTATCACANGYNGDPFLQCLPVSVYRNNTVNPCVPSPCGPQDVCNAHNGVAICDPCAGLNANLNPACRPECISNLDCPFDNACLGQICQDPCPGSCGHNAICSVINHDPVCRCPDNLYGNPYEYCSVPDVVVHPETCDTIQCGPNTDCNQQNGVFSCVCKKNYYGNPLIGCRPECVINTDCTFDKSCSNLKCVNPCLKACGLNALCQVVNHYPVCYCPAEHTGDALVSCVKNRPIPARPSNPCDPSPCGPNSRCRTSQNGDAVCSCLVGYRGSPPVCQPECISSSECPQNKACVNLKCIDPCPGVCGIGARCEVIMHNPICSCQPGQQGDPFVKCDYVVDEEGTPRIPDNPCSPSPCGPNSICQIRDGRPVCSCIPNYIGGPPHCRPECVLSNECPQDKACIREKCQNPCSNTCGPNAECHVVAHSAYCNCKAGFEGDSFIGCTKTKEIEVKDPCNPSPCGENAQCTERNGVVKCTCIPPYIGDPYKTGCRPECLYNSDCPSNYACIKQHCRDPCPGVCGTNAECSIVNHMPVCTCLNGYQGDPFTGCRLAAPACKNI